jgi:hypothetical protein
MSFSFGSYALCKLILSFVASTELWGHAAFPAIHDITSDCYHQGFKVIGFTARKGSLKHLAQFREVVHQDLL